MVITSRITGRHSKFHTELSYETQSIPSSDHVTPDIDLTKVLDKEIATSGVKVPVNKKSSLGT